MKKIILLGVLFYALSAKANDTLTRAQVYDFSVGDTFDYRASSNQTVFNGGNSTTTSSTSYSRYVITNISYSLDSLTKSITRTRLFPRPDSLETLTLQNLSDYEVLLDTVWYGIQSYTISTDSISVYNGRGVDTINEYNYQYNNQEFVFANGLGCVLSGGSGGCGPCGGFYGYSTTLIYFNKGSESWGTPYYDFPTAIEQLSASTDQIQLFPTLNDGTFNIKITDAAMLPVNLVVYNITGQKIEQLTLGNLNNEVSMRSHSAGVYIWKALSGNQLIQTGKMIIH